MAMRNECLPKLGPPPFSAEYRSEFVSAFALITDELDKTIYDMLEGVHSKLRSMLEPERF